VLYPARFNDHSDIDLLVYGLPLKVDGGGSMPLRTLKDSQAPLIIDLKRAWELPASFGEFAKTTREMIS